MQDWNEALIGRYGGPGPRYTSYPTAPLFHEDLPVDAFVEAMEEGNKARRPLSLYAHVPFCHHVCYYCACNRIITADRSLAERYLQHLKKEIVRVAQHVDSRRQVTQLHWGGGTPTYLTDAQITELVYHLARHFNLREDDRGDYAIEIDPRTVNRARLGLLRGLGFNRLSIGVQDLNPLVQQAVNRIQSYEMISDTLGWARDFGFKSINVDLISGLPWQTEMTMARTLEQLINLKPERISLYGYAHLPDRFKIQRQIDDAALPSPTEKIRMNVRAGRMLQQSGYRFIGMDHFALESDEMAVAQRNGLLHRNFQGYTLHGDADLLGMGVSAISQVGNLYVQNHKVLSDWQAAIGQDQLPHHKGYLLDKADLIRRDIIMKLLCDLRLDIPAFEQQWEICFRTHFADAMVQWRDFAEQGLVVFNDDTLIITEQGRLVSRALVQPFDAYLGNRQTKGFSRII
ncbi:oxygen-independent coproporphyrinogen III oxidase [Alcanivorax profundi]|uniref:Coproporphyrinogen-III oxidase n=1 Tax=Alcanivorax profundi TaxID=2338368 RepID=A0A418Y385_9GAMM|nr:MULTISPECIES: oxygen-independent coproporphyrinogen III oxidase [Alcanivorax]RJG20001.1 oxygen-independent coproporphyrinogen III oxidase [Alcanivorax profundi]